MPTQGPQQLTIVDSRLVHVDEDERFELSLPIESHRYQLSGVGPRASGRIESDALTAATLAAPLTFAATPLDAALGPQACLLDWT